MFSPPLCIEAFGFSFHKAPFVGRVKNAFEGNYMPRSILTVSALGVNEFLIAKGSPIKKPSVKKNTSLGEETAVVLPRNGRVAYLFRLCRYVSQAPPMLCAADLHRCGHSRSAV